MFLFWKIEVSWLMRICRDVQLLDKIEFLHGHLLHLTEIAHVGYVHRKQKLQSKIGLFHLLLSPPGRV